MSPVTGTGHWALVPGLPWSERVEQPFYLLFSLLIHRMYLSVPPLPSAMRRVLVGDLSRRITKPFSS
jgi:hypothetical protein